MIPAKLPRHVFKMREWNVCTQCVVRGDDGKYHVFFGRWPKSSGFSGWCTHAEVAHAVSDRLLGPYTFKEAGLFTETLRIDAPPAWTPAKSG